jgi:hypothetical protein
MGFVPIQNLTYIYEPTVKMRPNTETAAKGMSEVFVVVYFLLKKGRADSLFSDN